MGIAGLLVLLGLVVVVPTLVSVIVLTVSGRGATDAVRAARRHDTLITLSTLLVALVVAVGATALPVATDLLPAAAPGTLLAVGPFAVAVSACLVRLAGELTWPRPSGTVRSAPLHRRTVRDVAGWRLAVLAATALLLVVVLVVTGLTATDGTSVAAPERPVPGGGTVSGAAGPYPGWPYGVPMLAGLGLALGCTVPALRVIARRAPLDGQGHDEDDALRRRSAARLIGVVQACVGGATALVLLFAGSAARRAGTSHVGVGDVWHTLHDPGLVGLGTTALVVGGIVAVGSVVAASWPVRGARTLPSTSPVPHPAA